MREALSTGTVTDIGYVLFDYDSDAALYTWDSRVAVNFSERVLMLGNEKYAYNIDSVKYEVTSHFNEDLVKTQLRTMLYNLDWYNVFL